MRILSTIPAALLPEVVRIMATHDDEEAVRRIEPLLHEPLLVERATAWIPEAFGRVLVEEVLGARMLDDFTAFDGRGRPREFPLDREPVYLQALAYARQVLHDGPRELFDALAMRSSGAQALNQLLQDGSKPGDCVLTGPALVNLRAELYSAATPSLWSRLMGKLDRS